jgi:hypothetical protein
MENIESGNELFEKISDLVSDNPKTSLNCRGMD